MGYRANGGWTPSRAWTVLTLASALVLAAVLPGCGARPEAVARVSPEASGDVRSAEDDEGTGFRGFVVRREGGRILVVSSEVKDFGAQGGKDEFNDAIWFSGAPSDAEVGRRVKVWTNAIDQSYPGQARAERVEVEDDVRPDGASRSEAEAVRAALASPAAVRYSPLAAVVQSAVYDAASAAWTIAIAGGGGEGKTKLRVDDRTGRVTEPAAADAPAGSAAEMYALAFDAYLSASGEGMGDGICYIAVDWGKMTLGAEDREAALAGLGARRGVKTVASTLDQLKETGKTDEYGGLPDGVLLRVDETNLGADEAVLTGSVYRSPKGGAGIRAALAREDGGWRVKEAQMTWIN
ncbi:YobA family protein [Cohnella nanjingensis]|uniref:YobA family protein n=1 Tax=Cohnella nanjingensis TaxID=1387779 RepID=A0A7X0VGD1_9BACL|nr:YobA family protein [Cohnella nanjingensis]MBB6671529.1 YobA family protein [Cohnella nanjingensis]